MMIDKSILLILLFVINIGCSNKDVDSKQEENDFASYINPFIGASTSTDAAGVYHGLGKTFPGAATPFGMVQISPNTITGGDNGSDYSYEHLTIEGFALTQISGVGWNGDLGNFLVMPTIGELKTSAGTAENPDAGYRSRYSKEDEKAEAGYYSVLLNDYEIKTELAATRHCGMYRFTFPENENSRIQVDLPCWREIVSRASFVHRTPMEEQKKRTNT
jgi:putative alpha-1,2-mannosidase